MKTVANGAPQVGEAQKVVTRARGRQGWLFTALAALIVAGAFGIGLNRPKPVGLPAITFASASSPSSGMIGQILVQPGEHVRKGELLAVLDFSHLQAQSEAAFGNVIAAAEEPSPGVPVVTTPLPPPGMTGTFAKRAVPVKAAPAPLPAIQPTPEKNAPSAGPQANGSDLATLEQKAADSSKKIDAETKAIQALQQTLASDQDAANAAQSLVVSLTSVASRTKADSDKMATLLAEGVVSANEASKAQSYAQQAQGQLQEAKISAAQAEATLGDTQRALDEAQRTLAADQRELEGTNAKIDEAKKHPRILTQPSPPVQTPLQPPVKYELQKLKGPIAPSGPPVPLGVNFTTPDQAVQRLQRAEHELNSVDRQFSQVCVYAQADGLIVKVAVRPGQIVAPGTILFQIRR